MGGSPRASSDFAARFVQYMFFFGKASNSNFEERQLKSGGNS